MPLDKKLRGGIWWLSGTVAGRRIRESTKIPEALKDLAEARRVERERELIQRSVFGEKGLVTFAEAVDSYLSAEQRSPVTADYIDRLLQHFGPRTMLKDIDQVALDRAYKALLRPDVVGATKIRAVLTPLRAVLQHAATRRWCDVPAFEEPSTRDSDTRTDILLPDQATAFVQGATALEHRAYFTFQIACGTRASEAFDLPWSDVDLRGARARVRQKQGTWRELDLPRVAIAALISLPHREGFVFRPPARMHHGKMVQAKRYADHGRAGGGQVATAFGTACRRAGLPGRWVETTRKADRYWQPELRLHDLRHTWASWHYLIHRSELKLMLDGGWSNQGQIRRYTHLMPHAYRDEVIAWLNGEITEAKAVG